MEIWQQEKVIQQSWRILDSYRHWMGEELMDLPKSREDWAQTLFEAPLVVVSHNSEDDPVLNYGNRAALELWEMTWDSFIKTPSRLTAEILNRQDRAQFLAQVRQNGFSKNYRGIRISSTGRRFCIEDACVWNLLDEKQNPAGQAACFKSWTYL